MAGPEREGFLQQWHIVQPTLFDAAKTTQIRICLRMSMPAPTSTRNHRRRFYTGTVTGLPYPANMPGNYFFADFVRLHPARVRDSGSGVVCGGADFAPAASIVGLITGVGRQSLLSCGRKRPTTANCAAFAMQAARTRRPLPLTVTPGGGPIETVFHHSALGCSTPESRCAIDLYVGFGDGSSIATTMLTVTHVYTTAGAKTVTLTVTDSGTPPRLACSTCDHFFRRRTPTATIRLENVTAPGRPRYFVGDTWALMSPQPAATTGHLHLEGGFPPQRPFTPVSAQSAARAAFVTNYNESDPDVWYRLADRCRHLWARKHGSCDILPGWPRCALTRSRPGLNLKIGEQQVTAPYEISRVVGVDFR